MISKCSLKVLSGLAVAMLLLGVSGLNQVNAEDDFSDKTIKTVATTGMVGDIVRIVGGDRIELTTLMGPGIDPHLYKASAGDVETLDEADLIFYSGLHLEAKLVDVFEQMGDAITTRAVTVNIPEENLLAWGDGDGVDAYDPHVWFDVTLWAMATEEVRDVLKEIDPAHAADYDSRAAAYLEELATLDTYVTKEAERIAPEDRVLITAHDAFSYFAKRYGFEVRGLQGVSTASEAGTDDVQELADFIVERQIPVIFVESSVSPRTIEALQEAVRDQGAEVEIGGQLFSDAMGDKGTFEGTYLGMVTHNIDTIVSALLLEK